MFRPRATRRCSRHFFRFAAALTRAAFETSGRKFPLVRQGLPRDINASIAKPVIAVLWWD